MTTTTYEPFVIRHSQADRHVPARRKHNIVQALRDFARSLDDVGRHNEAAHRRNQAELIERRYKP